MPHSNNKQFPTITFYSSHLHHLTTTSNLGSMAWWRSFFEGRCTECALSTEVFVCRIGRSQNCSPWLRRPRAEHIPLTQASIQPGSIEFSITSRTCFINLYGPQGLVPTALVEGASSDQYPAAVCQMEGNATAQKLSCGSKHSGSYISTEECANGNAPEEFKILGQSRRPSPLSSLRPRKHKYTHVK